MVEHSTRYEYQKKYREENPDKRYQERQGWAKRNPEKVALASRRHALKKKGITLEDYDRMLEEQGGRCVLCRCEPSESVHGVLHVDHDHKTGRVRGLLCHRCNVALGQFDDDPERLRLAAKYVEGA